MDIESLINSIGETIKISHVNGSWDVWVGDKFGTSNNSLAEALQSYCDRNNIHG